VSRQRSKARGLAVQAVYQWQMAGQSANDIYAQFMTEHAGKKVDTDYFRNLLHGVIAHRGRIDEGLGAYLDRDIERVDPVERAVLRVAGYELLEHPEVPYRVVINEAVELAKVFGAEQGHRYVNGVLDKAARRLRPLEMAAQGS